MPENANQKKLPLYIQYRRLLESVIVKIIDVNKERLHFWKCELSPPPPPTMLKPEPVVFFLSTPGRPHPQHWREDFFVGLVPLSSRCRVPWVRCVYELGKPAHASEHFVSSLSIAGRQTLVLDQPRRKAASCASNSPKPSIRPLTNGSKTLMAVPRSMLQKVGGL